MQIRRGLTTNLTYWRRQLLSPRGVYVLTFLGIGLVVASTTILPFQWARHEARSQDAQFQAALQVAQGADAIMSKDSGLRKIALQQIGPTNTFAANSWEAADNFNSQSPGRPLDIWPPLLPPSSYPSRYVAAINKASRDSEPARVATAAVFLATKRFLLHDANVTRALVNILSYNPQTDFGGSTTTADRANRLQRAKDGLSKTHANLADINAGDDPSLADVSLAIQHLQTARDNFAAGGSLAEWSDQVDLQQTTILGNRIRFWSERAGALDERLIAVINQLTTAHASWLHLTGGL